MGNNNTNTILMIGLALAGAWCFLAGPCQGMIKDVLGKLKGGGGGTNINTGSNLITDNAKSIATGQAISSHPVPPIKNAQTTANLQAISGGSGQSTTPSKLAGDTSGFYTRSYMGHMSLG